MPHLINFFDLAPWIFIFLIPALAMRSFSDEFKTGTFEILQTRPLTKWQIVLGKYFSVLVVIIIALLPTLLYVFTIHSLSAAGGIDSGGNYRFLYWIIFSCSCFCGNKHVVFQAYFNAVIAFLLSAFACLILYFGFSAISKLPVFTGNADYYIEMLGIDFHYQSISRGVVDTRDIIYFFSIIFLFLFATQKNLNKK